MSRLPVAAALKTAMIFVLLLAGTVAIASPPESSMSCTVSRFDKVVSLPQASWAIVCDTVNRKLLVVGDYHGSNEIPDFVAQLVSDASSQRSVRLGLELETFEQKHIQTYMASHGTAVDRADLLQDGFWAAGQGRMSQAIVRLIESARKLREQGRDVDVFTTVTDYPGDAAIKQAGGENAYRSAAMAKIIHDEVQHGVAHQLVIAFMGNTHSAYIAATRGKDSTVTERLLSDAPYLVNLDLHGGVAWNCTASGCGPYEFSGKSTLTHGTSLLSKVEGLSDGPTQVRLQFPPLTPSPPAKNRAPKH